MIFIHHAKPCEWKKGRVVQGTETKYFFDRKRQRDILIEKRVQEKDEESSHQRKAKQQEYKNKKLQWKQI